MTILGRKEHKHESFGMVSLSRVNGGGLPFFGSSIIPDTYISLSIARGCKSYGLGQDWYGREEELIEVLLTPAQFAELITTMNNHSGVPCTINRIENKGVPRFTEDEDPKEARSVVADIKKRGTELSEALDSFVAHVDSMIASKAVTKKAGEELKKHFYVMNQHMKSNIPFYLTQLDEAAEKIVTEKKAEMDAFQAHMITRLGLSKLEDLKLAANEAAPQIEKKEQE